jgi:hypothetical protein
VVRVVLARKRAVLVGLDLLSLSFEPLFQAEAQKRPAPDGPEPVNPAGVDGTGSREV